MRIDSIGHTMAVRSVEKGLIRQDQAEVYEYGLALILTTIFSFIVALVWGYIFQCLAEVIAFLIVFIPLRMYTGGYHASTYFRCLLAFIFMLVILKLFMEWISTPMIAPITVLVSLITLLSVFLFAPIQHPNAPITGSDRPRFKRVARLICLFDILLMSVFIYTPLFKEYHFTVLVAGNCALFFASLLIIIGQLKHTGKEAKVT